jgi:SOS response associated peptidase (SRAP)
MQLFHPAKRNPVKDLVGKVHNRMPVILDKERERAWLNPDTTEPKELLPLLTPYPADLMDEWHVSDAAKNPRKRHSRAHKTSRLKPTHSETAKRKLLLRPAGGWVGIWDAPPCDTSRKPHEAARSNPCR